MRPGPMRQRGVGAGRSPGGPADQRRGGSRRAGIGVLEAAAERVPRLAVGEAGWLGEAELLGGWVRETASG